MTMAMMMMLILFSVLIQSELLIAGGELDSFGHMLKMILMILFSCLTGLRLPTGRQTAARLTSVIAWSDLLF